MPAIRPRFRIGIVLAALSALALVVAGPASAHGGGKGADVYKKRNLVSDIDGVARITDPNLVNPWGLAFGPTTPAWVSDNGMDVSTLYSGGVRKSIPVTLPLVVGIPGGGSDRGGLQRHRRLQGRRRPGALHLRLRGRDDHRVERGHRRRDRGDDAGAVYKGLAIASKGSTTMLYAANFHTGKIDVFNDAFAPVTVPGGFVDPNLPADFAPFNVQEIAGLLVVSFAQQDPNSSDELHGPGLGYVDVFDTQRPPAAAAGLPGRPGRALGPGGRPAALRAVQRGPAGRQLRRRGDQRLRPADRRLPRHAREQGRQPDQDQRPLGAALRQRRDRHAAVAPVHRGHRRRGPRPLRRDRRPRQRRVVDHRLTAAGSSANPRGPAGCP